MLRTALVALLTGATLLAAPVEDPHRIRIQFRALSMGEPIEGLGYLEGGDFRPVDIFTNRFSALVTYVGANPLRLAVMTKPTEEPAPEVVQAQNQLREAEAGIESLNQDLYPLHTRLAMLTTELVERGKSAPAGTEAEINQLRQMANDQSRRISKLESLADQARKVIANPPERKKKPAPQAVKPNASATKPAERHPHTPLAEVTLPGSGRYLLLINRTAKGTQVRAIDDKPEAFPFGTLQFINLSGEAVIVSFGEDQIPLKPGAKGLVPLNVANHSYADGGVYLPEADGSKLAESLRIFKDDKTRILYFVLPPEEGATGIRLKEIVQREQKEDIIQEPNAKGAKK